MHVHAYVLKEGGIEEAERPFVDVFLSCVFVCVCHSVRNPLLATAEAPVPGKGTTFGLISCLRVQGTLFRLAHQRRRECETEPDYNKLYLPQGLVGLPVS